MISNIASGAEVLIKHLELKPTCQWESEVLSETPGLRLVTRYTFRGASENRKAKNVESVGKFYADQATGEHCYRAMDNIYQLLKKHNNSPLAIPEPIFYSYDNQLLSLKWVGYRPYSELINNRNYKHYLRLVGRALAYFHQLPVDYGKVKTLQDHLDELITPHPAQVSEAIPEFTLRIRAIIHKLYKNDLTLVIPFTPAPLHRDFHLRQLFCDNNKLWVIDWDMYGLGDPALDVGNFLVYLATRIPAKADKASSAFLEGYRSLNPNLGAANINQYKAFTYLRLACKAFRLQGLGWESRVDLMLARSEHQLGISVFQL